MAENYIRYYENVIDNEFCDNLIDKFEQNVDKHLDIKSGDQFSFKELRLLDHLDIFQDEAQTLKELFMACVKTYKEDCNITSQMFPRSVGYENFRMKRYLPDGIDQFDNHVDVGDYASARRFLVFFLYLNEVEGGETAFEQYGLKVEPKKGRLLVFPPMWTHLHAGRKPINKPKYIVGSYLHYLDEE